MRRKAGTGLTSYEKGVLAILATSPHQWATVADLKDPAAWTKIPHATRTPNEATIYRILSRFTDKGLVDSKWLVPSEVWVRENRPVGAVRLSKTGRKAAKELTA